MSSSLRRLRLRLRYWFHHRARQNQLHEEMEYHLANLTEEFMDNGMPENQARAAAHRKFGNLALTAEDSRVTWLSRWVSDALQDLRYTLRNLRRDAGFTTFAILIVGLGVGACATVFSIVNALLLRPLPFHEPSRLVWLANLASKPEQTAQVGHILGLRDKSRTLADLAGYFAYFGNGDVKLTGGGSEPERLTGVRVTQNFLPLLGVNPLLGRNFTVDEGRERIGRTKVVLLSFNLWKRRFNSDPAIVGSQLTLNETPMLVAGVLPETFDLGAVFLPGTRVDLYLPFPLTEETDRFGNTLAVVGRLKPGATVPAAQDELTSIAKELERLNPKRNDIQAQLTVLDQHVNGRLRPAVFVLVCAVGVVMLIVCANLSNLQLARTANRQREMAVRVALGAGRQRLLRQMLTESVLLSFAGGLLGLVLAVAGTRALSSLTTVSIPMLASVRVDPAALLFTLAVAIGTGILFGLMPALQIPTLAVHDTLKDSARGSTEGHRRSWARGTLAVSEIALACVLVVGAGLLIRSFLRVLDVDLGFRPEKTAALRIDPSRRYNTSTLRNNYYTDALHRVRSLTGIQGAGLTDVLPLGGDRSWGVGAKGQLYDRHHYHEAFVRIVSEGYFNAIGISLKAGRDFSERDDSKNPPVIVINETMARAMWPGRSAVGQTVQGAGNVDREVVGVVGDVHHLALEQASGNEMYLPIRQSGDYSAVDLVVRSTLPPAQFAGAVREALRPIEPELSTREFRPVQDLVDKSVSPRRFIVFLLSGFSAFALVLASLGIYGVISYSVSQRTQEIGIRMAIGASAGHVQRDIIFQTLRLAALGMIIGLIASWMLTRALTGLLFGVSTTDPLTYLAMLTVLTTVAAIAGYLPARRASRIDPMQALRTN